MKTYASLLKSVENQYLYYLTQKFYWARKRDGAPIGCGEHDYKTFSRICESYTDKANALYTILADEIEHEDFMELKKIAESKSLEIK